MKRNDWFLIFGTLVIAVVFWIVRCFVMSGDTAGSVEVRIDGEIAGIYALSEDVVERFVYEDGTYNVMEIKDGRVRISEADCPDRHCVNKGEIYRENETIICLPHKLVIKVTGSGSEGPDVVAE